MIHSVIKKSQLEGAKRLDAEYYQPEYLEVMNKIRSFSNGFKTIRERGVSVVSGPFGSSLKSDAYLDTGVPFLRISDLRDFFVNRSKLVYISEKDNSRLKQSQLFPNDLVLSKVGHTIGTVSAVPEEFKVCNISENNIGIKFKDKSISTEEKNYILVFLNSKFGFNQIFRRISGNAQPKLNVQDVYDIIYPVPDDNIVQETNISLAEANKSLNQAGIFYEQAENLLLEELGLTGFEKDESLSWMVNLSNVKIASRMDADYFQPKYAEMIKTVEKGVGGWDFLENLTTFVNHGVQPPYSEDGEIIFFSQKWIGDKSIDYSFLTDDNEPRVSKSFFENERNKSYLVKKNDILYYSVGANLGYCHNYLEDESIAIGSFVNLIRGDETKINPVFLGFCLNSVVGRMQAERDKSGLAQPYIYAKNLRKFKIPIVKKVIQQKIAEFVRQSHEARKRSKQLLEEAKRTVEEAVEKEARD